MDFLTEGLGQPIVSFAALAVAVYAVRRANRNQQNRLAAWIFFGFLAFLAFGSLSYIDLLPIESAHTVAFGFRVASLIGVTLFVLNQRNPRRFAL